MHLCRAVAVRHHILCFYCPDDVGEAARRYFFRWQVIGLGLWVQIGTADGGKCCAVDAMMSTVGVVLGGGMRQLGHTPHTFPLIVADGLQRKGGEGKTDCAGVLVKWP